MKKQALGWMALLFTLSLWSETLTFAVGNWEPYISETLMEYGCSARAMNQACEKAGFKCEYLFEGSWKRAWIISAKAESHGTFPWASNKEREEQMYHCETPIVSDGSYAFYLKKDYPKGMEIKSYADINNYPQAKPVATRGYIDEMEMDKAGVKAHVVNNDTLAWKMLEMGRVNVLVASKSAGMRIMQQNTSLKIGEDIALSGPVINYDYYLWYTRINPDYTQKIKKICTALKEMQKSGELAKLSGAGACKD